MPARTPPAQRGVVPIVGEAEDRQGHGEHEVDVPDLLQVEQRLHLAVQHPTEPERHPVADQRRHARREQERRRQAEPLRPAVELIEIRGDRQRDQHGAPHAAHHECDDAVAGGCEHAARIDGVNEPADRERQRVEDQQVIEEPQMPEVEAAQGGRCVGRLAPHPAAVAPSARATSSSRRRAAERRAQSRRPLVSPTTMLNRTNGKATRFARSLTNALTPRRSTSTRAKNPAIKKNADMRNM